MARTAECVAPEGNQDRDEWMTVIEMQEYMRASRNKAYDLIWSGEIDSYRLGRKWRRRPPREPPAAGHAREPRDERSSRTTMTKSTSRSQVRPIASTNAIFGADEARDAAHQPQRHAPARPPLHSPPEHAIRLLVAY